jgi:predicted transposase YbfD/YdcC
MDIFSVFSEIEDFRVQGRCLHHLSEILGLILVGVIADCDDFCEIADYGKGNLSFLRTDLGFHFKNGIPSEDTLERVFKHLNPLQLAECYTRFLGDLSLSNKQIAFDGKELRSTIPKGKKHALVQMVNVWVVESGLSFGQYQVDKKSNEITAIPSLLKSLDCQGAIISIDAIGCQKEIVRQICAQKADYVIALKENQGELYRQAVQEMHLEQAHLASYESFENQHGRKETRKLSITSNLKWIENSKDWEGLSSIVMVERSREIKGLLETSKKYYISSLANKTAQQMLEYIRNHWGIENGLHWQLDISFREDDAKLKNEKAIINLHQVRKWALVLLKRIPEKISIKRKRKKAHRDNQYLKTILN